MEAKQIHRSKDLKDMDKDHPFYSDEAIRASKKRVKQLEEEERLMIQKNREHYRNRKLQNEEDEKIMQTADEFLAAQKETKGSQE